MPADHLSWVPADLDLSMPNPARVYDYILGGANNFEVDREFARSLLITLPDARTLAQEGRAFLRRVVTFLAQQGVRQFIDLGSGIPTVGNTHEVAQRVAADARVVYVDCEPIAVTHGELILQDNTNAVALRADIRDPGSVLDHPLTRRLIDFDQPVAVLMFLVLHFLPDPNEVGRLVARYRDATVPGSYLGVSHLTRDGRPDVDNVIEQYRRGVAPITERTRAEVTELFFGYDLVAPGVVFTREWRPEIDMDRQHPSPLYGAVGQRI